MDKDNVSKSCNGIICASDPDVVVSSDASLMNGWGCACEGQLEMSDSLWINISTLTTWISKQLPLHWNALRLS